jgi:ferrous iron transport protein B
MASVSPPTVAAPQRALKIALIGNPNTGKSTLFNALAGMNARVGNYPGVTVEKKIGRVKWDGRSFELIDLPGTYSLSPRSPDEMVSVDVLLGRQPDVGRLDAVVCITDATNLERHLYLVSQILDVGLPVILVLNMWDAVGRQGQTVDVETLRRKLGIAVVPTEAHRRRGIDDVRNAIAAAVVAEPPSRPRLFPDIFYDECGRLEEHLAEQGFSDVPYYLRERLLLDVGGIIERRYVQRTEGELSGYLAEARQRLHDAGCPAPFVESQSRYRWAKELLADVVTKPAGRQRSVTDRIDAVLTHRVAGLLIFAVVMLLVFQTIYTWAKPLMDACKDGQQFVAAQVEAVISPGPLRSLLVDGVIAGVGGVIVFVPQIALLFFFISLLEDCGYMARAAYMMDRVMSAFGLSGKSFLPLMSSFACAVPGVMATRTIDNYRDRMVTILVAPLMSCSARLPVYLLLIAAFIPATYLGGWLSLQGLVLFAMSSLGLLVAIPVAWLLRKTFFRGQPTPFLMEMPEYKLPSPRLVLYRVYDRGKAFVVRAGTLIFAATIVIWAAGYFPGDHSREIELTAQIEQLESAEQSNADEAGIESLKSRKNAQNASLIQASFLGRAGHAVEPVVKPLGWDWKIGVGAIASFPAREVIIATLGTIYSLGGEVEAEDEGLQGALKKSKWPDGSPVYNVPVALSIMVFFALCAQCVSTLITIRRETNSWRWPVFCFTYMTTLAYVGALLTYQIGASF